MTETVFLALLGAAALHASWNAITKTSGDGLRAITLMNVIGSLIALAFLPFVPVPKPAAVPWLAGSVTLHVAYFLLLVRAYSRGDLGQIYPIIRGCAPLLTLAATALAVPETMSSTAIVGIIVLSTGVGLLSFRGGRSGELDKQAVIAALLTSLSICGYTVADGLGAREYGSGGYAFWLFFLDGPAIALAAVALRGRHIFAAPATEWRNATLGAGMLVTSYTIAIWAMTVAPIAFVAALRETSVLFAALISVAALGEPLTRWRVSAAILVVAGAILLHAG